mgnify:CR=1 FL=1
MPRIIDHAREQIQNVAAEMLERGGYARLTIRAVARRCGIGVGTIYNYYPSKDDMVRDIMLRDWAQTRAAMEKITCTAGDLHEGVRNFFSPLQSFIAAYRDTWRVMSGEGGAQVHHEIRYSPAEFRREMDAMLRDLLDRTSARYQRLDEERKAFLRGFVAKNLVAYAMEPATDLALLEEVLLAPLE